MTTTKQSDAFQYGNGPLQINDRLEFAAVIRDITGIDTWYPVNYHHGDIHITSFKIANQWQIDLKKYGYYWMLKIDDQVALVQKSISDIWTAKVRLCEYIGCAPEEINDIFWNGKDRSEVGCSGCPCNKIEADGKR